MSFIPDDNITDIDTNSLLLDILEQLKLLNARIEEAFETKINEEDVNR